MLPLAEKQEPERWVRELKAAGWRRHHMTLWQHPDGRYYRGPYLAWCVMKLERGSDLNKADEV